MLPQPSLKFGGGIKNDEQTDARGCRKKAYLMSIKAQIYENPSFMTLCQKITFTILTVSNMSSCAFGYLLKKDRIL